MRRDWILKRGDVEEYTGREVVPQDNGYLSDEHSRLRNGGLGLRARNLPSASRSAPLPDIP